MLYEVITDEVEQLNSVKDSSLKTYTFKQEDVFNNPDHAFLIAENGNISKLINHSKLKIGDIADCVTGFYSGDDKRFLQVISPELKNGKNYDLVNADSISSDYKNNADILSGIDGDKYFLPIVKGGNTKYLKPESWFMNFV